MRVALLFLVLFVVTLTAAAVLYPGGSWRDAETPGFDVWVNYWCDLMRLEGLNGEPNRLGGALGRTAFVALGLAAGATFHAGAGGLAGPAMARVVRLGGLVTTACVALVGLASYAEYRVFHAVVSMSGGLVGSATALVLEHAVWRSGRATPWRKGIGAVFGVLAVATAVVYAEVIWRGGSSSVLPVVQKPATLALALWMATVAVQTESGS